MALNDPPPRLIRFPFRLDAGFLPLRRLLAGRLAFINREGLSASIPRCLPPDATKHVSLLHTKCILRHKE